MTYTEILVKVIKRIFKEMYDDVKRLICNIYEDRKLFLAICVSICFLLVCIIGVIFPITGILMIITINIIKNINNDIYVGLTITSCFLMSFILMDIGIALIIIILLLFIILKDKYKIIKKDIERDIKLENV